MSADAPQSIAVAAGILPPAASGRGIEVERQALVQRRRGLVLIAGTVLLAVLVVISMAIGASGLAPLDIVSAIGGGIIGQPPAWLSHTDYLIVWQLRLPRAALTIVAGAALSVSGVILQALLRNPLVSPFTLGISPAAAFGASIALVAASGTGGAAPLTLVLSALTAAVLCSTFVLGLAATRKMAPIVVILLGVALTQLFEALTAAMQYIADEATLQSIVRWTFGSVNGADWNQVLWISLAVVLLLPAVFLKANALNAIAFAGDDAAGSLGVNVPVLRLAMAAISVTLTAVVVAFTGVIGFISLVGPHIARLVIGSDHRLLVPFSLITGALLLVVADVVGRILMPPAIVPVGIVIAFVGAPLFINLILTRRNSLL